MPTLPENDRLTGPMLATAGQVDFPGDFPLLDAVEDTPGTCVRFRRERGGVAAILEVGAFSIPNQTDAGFTLRLAEPAQAGDRCWIIGFMNQKRLRAHTPNGATRTPVLEGDARDATARAQEARRDLDQALMVAPGESPGLPLTAEQRRGRVLGFTDTPGATQVAVPNSAVAIGEDLAAANEARVAAETARDQVLATAETVSLDIAEATQAAVTAAGDARDGAEDARDQSEAARDAASAYLAAFPANIIYDTEAAGRAAVADGAHFWVRTADGLQSYRRVNAGTVSTAGPLQPSLAKVGTLLRQPVVDCVVTSAPGVPQALIFTPKPGYTFVPGGGQTFTGISPYTSVGLGIIADVVPLTGGDYRQVLLPGGAAVPAGALNAGEPISLSFAPTGKFVLTSARQPVPPIPPAPSYYIVLAQVGGTANDLVLQATTPLPNNTGAGIVFRFPNPPNKAEGPINVRIVGINDADPWPLLGPTGDTENDRLLGTDIYSSKDDLEITRFSLAAASWSVKRVLNPTLAKVGSAAGGGDPFTAWAGAAAAALAFTGSL